MNIVDKIKKLLNKEETVEVKNKDEKILIYGKCCKMNDNETYLRCHCINMFRR